MRHKWTNTWRARAEEAKAEGTRVSPPAGRFGTRRGEVCRGSSRAWPFTAILPAPVGQGFLFSRGRENARAEVLLTWPARRLTVNSFIEVRILIILSPLQRSPREIGKIWQFRVNETIMTSLTYAWFGKALNVDYIKTSSNCKSSANQGRPQIVWYPYLSVISTSRQHAL